MGRERTLSIIKPDCVHKNVIGKILQRFEDNHLQIVGMQLVHLTKEQAQEFYKVHSDKGFFDEVVEFMISGPVVVSALEGENALLKNRDLMGATNPKDADAGTIRRDFCDSIEANGVHGSDSLENAQVEIDFFFKSSELHPRLIV